MYPVNIPAEIQENTLSLRLEMKEIRHLPYLPGKNMAYVESDWHHPLVITTHPPTMV